MINNVTITSIRPESVVIEWDTTEFGTSKIEYGTSISYSYSTTEEPFRYYHKHTISSLIPGTTYYFKITSVKYNNQIYTYEGNFITLTNAEYNLVVINSRSDGRLPVDYYINNNNGIDGTPNDGTLSKPFKTVNYVLSFALPGDTVYIMYTGTDYNETISFPRSGVDIAPITVKSYGGTVTFTGNGTSTMFSISLKSYINIIGPFNSQNYGSPLRISESSYIYASDINSLSSTDTGVCFQMRNGTNHCTFERLTVDGTVSGANAIMIFGSDYPSHNLKSCHHDIIKNCEVKKAPGHNGIDIHTNNEYINIEGCYVHNSGDNNIYIHAVQTPNRYITLRNNIVHDQGMNGIYVYSHDILLDGNIAYNSYVSWRGGIALFSVREENQIDSYNLYAINNITYNCYNGIFISNYYGTYLDTVVLDGNFHGTPWSGSTYSVDVSFEKTPITNSIVKNLKGYNEGNIVRVRHTAGQIIPYIFTDGRVFKTSSGLVEYTTNGSNIIPATGSTTFYLYDMTAIPQSGVANITINKFDTTLPKGNILIDFILSGTDNTNFTVQSLKIGTEYLIKDKSKAGVTVSNPIADSSGKIVFTTYPSSYVIEEGNTICPQPICGFDIIQGSL